MIDVLVLAWRDQIGFVPDADVAAVVDISTKLRPGGRMSQVRLFCIAGKRLERFAVLDGDRGSAEPKMAADEAKLGVLMQPPASSEASH
jgi:hypothetical protein